MLASLLREMGVSSFVDFGTVADERGAVKAAFEKAS
jgi:molybdopterin biosynthesis enzyme